jgi:CBS domain-containing membrane protein
LKGRKVNSAIERLLSLRVSDVMNKRVISVSNRDAMQDAARRMTEHSISGAPVVDERGCCVGVLSATDFVRERNCACADNDGVRRSLVQDGRNRPWQIDACRNDLVADHMSAAVQSIAADKLLLAAARAMCAQHIHRLPVLDAGGRPIGMITSLDVVAAVVAAIEE